MPPRCTHPNNPRPRDKGWLHYVEPYYGGGAVQLALEPEGISEVVNDINGPLMNFWNALQSPKQFKAMKQYLDTTPFADEEYDLAKECVGIRGYGAQWAAMFFIFCRQSLAGRMDGFASITRNRTRRGMNEQVSAWLNAIEGLPAVHERMKRVLVLNKPALDVIRNEDGPRTLFYLDPPYLHSTRATTGEYEHEMTAEQHVELLRALGDVEGKFLLSGYPSDTYESAEKSFGWKRHEVMIPNSAAGGKKKRMMVECVWTNF